MPAGAAAVAAANKPVLGRVQQRHNAFADDDEDEAEEEVLVKRELVCVVCWQWMTAPASGICCAWCMCDMCERYSCSTMW